jgi:hypothetical protein
MKVFRLASACSLQQKVQIDWIPNGLELRRPRSALRPRSEAELGLGGEAPRSAKRPRTEAEMGGSLQAVLFVTLSNCQYTSNPLSEFIYRFGFASWTHRDTVVLTFLQDCVCDSVVKFEEFAPRFIRLY